MQLPFHKNQTFLALMSDSNGFGTGGVSSVITVGESVSNASCNTTDPGMLFDTTLLMKLITTQAWTSILNSTMRFNNAGKYIHNEYPLHLPNASQALRVLQLHWRRTTRYHHGKFHPRLPVNDAFNYRS